MKGDGKSDGIENVAEEKAKIEEIRPEEDDESQSCRTFIVHNEDHTLGNSLRYMVMKDPRVQFCGYTIPHPSEDKINFRIQTDQSCSAEDALRTGIDNLKSAAEIVLTTFEKAVKDHKQRNP